MKRLSFAFAVFLVLFSCSYMTKEKYLLQYKTFITEVKKDYKNYSAENWSEKDRMFNKYNTELYSKFETEFSIEDKILLTKYRIEYDIYRYHEETKETLLDIFNAYFALSRDVKSNGGILLREEKEALKHEIENYVENDLNKDTDFLIDQGQKIKNTLSRILSEIATEEENNQD